MHLRYLPNAISTLRVLSVPVMIWLAGAGLQQAFAWLLLAAGLTDALDGWLARRYGWTSELGALLDSSADILVVIAALYGIWELQQEVFLDQLPVFTAVFAIWTIAHAAALVRYGRLASFHTRVTRIGIVLFGVFVLVLFFYAFVPWLFYVAGVVCFLGGVETLIMVIMIRVWTPDLRSGLLAALRRPDQQN